MSVVTVIFFIAIAIFILWKIISIYMQWKRKEQCLKNMPMGKTMSLLLGLKSSSANSSDELFNLVRENSNKHYPIYRISAFYADVVTLLNPDDVAQILSSTKHLEKSRVYGFLHQWLGTGLLTSKGTKWQTRRKMLTPAFHFSILQTFIDVFNEEAEKVVYQLQETLDKDPDDNIIDLVSFSTNFTLRSIFETAMGVSTLDNKASILKDYKKAIYQMGEIVVTRLTRPWLLFNFIYKLTNLAKVEVKAIETLHILSKNIIKERRQHQDEQGSKKKRLLDILLGIQMDEGSIDDEGIREEVDTFTFEGHDTTAMALTMILHTLAKYPIFQEQIYEELQTVVGENDPTYQQLQELKLMERVIKECLRLYPSVPFITRKTAETFTTTTGHVIPKDTIIHLHIYDIHRTPQHFPDPLKFNPDRFLPENVAQRHPYAYIPFSAGPRNCIGQRFAILELKTILVWIFRKFYVSPAHSVDENIQFQLDIVLRPKDKVRVRFVRRQQNHNPNPIV